MTDIQASLLEILANELKSFGGLKSVGYSLDDEEFLNLTDEKLLEIGIEPIVTWLCYMEIDDGKYDTRFNHDGLSQDNKTMIETAYNLRMQKLFNKDITKIIVDDYIHATDSKIIQHLGKSYSKHFLGDKAITKRRNIKHFQEARTVINFLKRKLIILVDGEVNFIDYDELRKQLQKDHHKPSKWKQIKADLVDELYTALFQASPSKDTTRLEKIAIYTVNNLLSIEYIDINLLTR